MTQTLVATQGQPLQRRFTAGQRIETSGLPLRIIQGKKGPNDLVIEWLTPIGWRKVEMVSVAVLTDFLYENEDVLYPQHRGFEGGKKFLKFLRRAVDHGYEAAHTELAYERRQRRLFD